MRTFSLRRKKLMSKVIPLADRAVLKVEEIKNKTAGGIILPDEHVDRQNMGQTFATVMAIGELCLYDCVTKPEVGDKVIIIKNAGLQYNLDGEEYRIVNSNDLIGIVK
jgi:chaperonin GroES